MCEASAYLEKDGKEELFMENVDVLKPAGDSLFMQDIFGEQRWIKGTHQRNEVGGASHCDRGRVICSSSVHSWRSGALFRIAVIDGQGGAIGATLIKKIMESHGKDVEVLALGTNAIATTQMLKAGANRGATGENAIRYSVHRVDAVVGPISIIIPYAFMGEVTPGMVEALGLTPAFKLLLPFTQEPVIVVGTTSEPLPHQVDDLVEKYLVPLLTAGNRASERVLEVEAAAGAGKDRRRFAE